MSGLGAVVPRRPARDPEPWSLRAYLVLLIAALVTGLVIAVEPLYGLILVVPLVLAAVIVQVSQPVAVIGLAIGLLYANVPAVAANLHGVPYIFAAISVPALLAGVAIGHARREGGWVVPRPMVWLLLYGAALVVATVRADFSSAALASLGAFVTEGLLLYVLVVNAVRSERSLRWAMATLVLVAAALGALTAYQAFTGRFGDDFFGFAQVDQADLLAMADNPDLTLRAAGPIGEKNRYGQVLAVALPIGLMLALHARRRFTRVVAAVGAAAALLGIVFTYSRGTAIAVVLTLLVMAATRGLPRWAVASAVAVLVVVAFAFPRYVERFSGAEALWRSDVDISAADGAVRGRLAANIGAVRVFSENPLTGVGPGNYPLYHHDAVLDLGLRVEQGRETHNLYPQLAAESGILGILAFGALAAATIRELALARRRLDRRSWLVEGALYMVVAYLCTGLFLHLSYERYLWLVLALAAVAGSVTGRGAPGDGRQPIP